MSLVEFLIVIIMLLCVVLAVVFGVVGLTAGDGLVVCPAGEYRYRIEGDKVEVYSSSPLVGWVEIDASTWEKNGCSFD